MRLKNKNHVESQASNRQIQLIAQIPRDSGNTKKRYWRSNDRATKHLLLEEMNLRVVAAVTSEPAAESGQLVLSWK